MNGRASQMALVVKNPSANAEDIEDVGSIPESGRSPGGGHGNPLQYSCRENPMDRGAWWATVHRVAQSWTRLKRLRMHNEWTKRSQEAVISSSLEELWTDRMSTC